MMLLTLGTAGAWAQDIYTSYTALAGDGGTGNEGYTKLVDNDKDTKWCRLQEATYQNSPVYCQFQSDELITPVGYVLTTGGDTGNRPGRNPKSWKIEASTDNSNWVTLEELTCDDNNRLPSANTEDKTYYFQTSNSAAYQYFKFTVTDIWATAAEDNDWRVMQLAEFQFIVVPNVESHDLADATVSGYNSFYSYNGSAITITPVVKNNLGTTLTEGTDYTKTLQRDGTTVSEVKECGNYTMTFTGMGDYTGTKTVDFTVETKLTVYDGTDVNQYIPMYGYYFDDCTKSECIIPKEQLTSLVGATINAITFYAKTVATTNSAWTTQQQVFIKEVDYTTQSSYTGTTDATTVFQGILPMPTTSADGYTITFSEGYVYNGNNLLIGVYNLTDGGKYNNVEWYGQSGLVSGVSASARNASLSSVSFTARDFLPKTTFTYEIPISTITVNSIGGSYGSVSGGGSYATGSEQTITATAGTNGYFYKWSDGITNASRTITVSDNATYTAIFVPKQIASATDWNNFADAVNGTGAYSGNSYNYGTNGKKDVSMTGNVGTAESPVSTMAGVPGDSDTEKCFSGTFNGNGNTITFDQELSEQYIAPFRRINGATIKNVKTTGNIKITSGRYAAGIAAYSKGTSNITNCISSMVITSTVSDDAACSGIAGQCNNTINISGCIFDGQMKGKNNWGGMVGYIRNGATANINNCLFVPESIEVGTGCYTFARDRGGSPVLAINNCYYNEEGAKMNTKQGKQAYIVTGDTGVNVELNGLTETYTYNVSGIAGYSSTDKGLLHNNTIIAGNGDAVSLNLSYTNTGEGALVPSNATYSTTSGATVTGNSSPYTLNMTAANTTINIATVSYTKTITTSGEENWTQGKGGYYFIASPVGNVNVTNVDNLVNSGNSYNLYCFNQEEDLEWVNYNSGDGFTNLESGKGYLYANQEDVTLTFTGAPYSGNETVTLSWTDGVRFSGWNLVGNPFAQNAYIDRAFYVINPDGRAEVISAITGSAIEPMEGIFVIAADEDDTSMTFSTEEPNKKAQAFNVSVTKVYSRDAAVIDRAIVRFDESLGLPKFQLDPNHTKLYIPQGGTDYAVLHTQAEGELPLNFKAEENGRYTLSVDIEKVSFDYLHLIDNMTGADVDLLVNPSYTFNARTTDYASRFKLVFSATGIEENAASTSTTFAYNNGSEWVINNAGDVTLQVVDMTGRILSSETINGNCTKVINAASGIYMLRLINGENVKVQKIVVR